MARKTSKRGDMMTKAEKEKNRKEANKTFNRFWAEIDEFYRGYYIIPQKERPYRKYDFDTVRS